MFTELTFDVHLVNESSPVFNINSNFDLIRFTDCIFKRSISPQLGNKITTGNEVSFKGSSDTKKVLND